MNAPNRRFNCAPDAEPPLGERWEKRGFSPADLLNLWPAGGDWRKLSGIAYGVGPRRKLDVYHPAQARGAPVVVYFYGGSWQGGSRDLYRFVGAALAARGIVTVVPDYSIFPQARFPEFLQDAAAAIAFARERAVAWGGDPQRLVLMGHSAGAHIAAMLAFDRQWLGAAGLNASSDIAGLVGLAGPYDFLPLKDPILQSIFGGADRAETQPISFVSGKAAPALLIAPRFDPVVNPDNTRRMAARIRKHGGDVRTRFYGRVGHLTLVGALAPPLRFLAPVLRDVTDFVWSAAGSHGLAAKS